MDRNDLMAQLADAAAALLGAEGIYPVLDYAWEGEDTVSDEYVGLAMWSTDAPFNLAFAIWDRESPPPLPSERDEIFHRAGEDFFGTMEFARNAIGSALYSFGHRELHNLLGDEGQFWGYRATATLWLNIASDRIRDYFVMARFGIDPKTYGQQHEKNGIYARPFRMHDQGATPYAKSTALKLVPLAEELGRLRRTRNEIVHSLSSRQGHNAMISLKNQREEATKHPYVSRSSAVALSAAWVGETAKTLSDERLREFRDALNVLKEWYMLLVEASALAFEFEYWKRIGK